jgi:ankyrin repeat protein
LQKGDSLARGCPNWDNQIVKDLLEAADPELACFPKEGSSPLYLAISLKEDTIAETLHEESKDKVLSYLGPDGQNALHAAVLRGPGTQCTTHAVNSN